MLLGGRVALVVTAALWAVSTVVTPAQAQTAVYSCVDKNGRRLTADRPIIECNDREQRVLDATGTERRRIGPSLTETERATLDAQRRAEAEQKARVVEQRRRERVLIARYPDEAAHNAERAIATETFGDLIGNANRQIELLKAERKQLNTELEFYQGDMKKAPVKLQRRFNDNDEAIAEQQRYIATQLQEKKRVQLRFDTELQQLKVLWAADKAAAATPASAPSGAASR